MAPVKSFGWMLLGICLALVRSTNGLGSTDTITWGGDVSRAGYQTNHNMDPAIVGSPSFGQIFKTQLPGNWKGIGAEQIFSQPLVYTGADGIQYVYLATTQNNIYKLDAKTGAIVAKRNLWVPFLSADLDGCPDIQPTVGVTATGVIDPATSIWYFTAKTYSQSYQDGNFSPSNSPGRLNGRYYFHAINTADLTDAFAPTPLEGTIFRNNPNRMFISGNQHQRPALLQVGKFIYAGFASHCVKWNFTGAIMGFDKSTGTILEAFATEGGPEANTVPGGGVWMSGGGLAYDGKGSMFFATGNGYASQLAANGQSVPGRNPPTALEEAAVNAKINDDGTISIVDFFMPWEKTQLDGADKDLGTSPLELLPSDTFSCPNHRRIGVVTGKSGKTYWLNLDDLGGYQNGDNKKDAVIQVHQNENSVYAGAGVMPLGGGYIYINVIQYPTHVFKFSCDAAGKAVFTYVADTAEKNAFTLGVGHGTTTSLNGQEGTGLLWVSDVQGLNLRIYNAIPPTNGNLTLVNSFNIDGVTKFTRPVFGDGRAYIGTTQGFFYGFGSPVSLPLNCSSPYTFPNTPIGNTSTPVTVTCVSNVQTTVNSIALNVNNGKHFNVSNLPATPFSVAKGGKFSFTAVFTPKSVGLLSNDVVVNTTNAAAGYSGNTPITLKGTANSASPLLSIRPNTVSFNAIVGQTPDGQPVTFINQGDAALTFQNISYSQSSETGPWVTPNTTADGKVQVGPFTFSNVPATIPGNSQAAVTVNYNPVAPGNDAVFVKAFSNGGNSILDVVGVAGSQPVALFEFQTPDGSGWVTYVPGKSFTFGNVTENTTRNLKFRLTNNGSSTAAPLSITVSKPPYGLPYILGSTNNIDLGEGNNIPAGQSLNATLYCSPPKTQVNTPGYSQNVTWTINTGDTQGKQFINFVCNAVSEQLGPTYDNGTARYAYVGCAKENNPGRQLATQVYADNTNNTNGKCTSACYAAGYTFAGTQYNSQCWCGNAIPLQFDQEVDCNYQCTGDSRQTCGGNGRYGNSTHISLFADSSKFNGNTTSPPLQIPQSYGAYGYVGCYAESGGKAMNAKTLNMQNMTVEYCGSFCSASKYTYFALEYASECYCGNSIAKTATLGSDSSCSMTCKGSNSEYCGAGNQAQIYMLNANATSSSSSTTISSTTSSASTVVPTTIVTTTASTSAVTTDTASTASTATTVSSSTTTTSTSATPTYTGPAAPAKIGNYLYQTCYTEVGGRALTGPSKVDGAMTNNVCAAFCAGYTYFATEYGQECYCANQLASGSAPATDGRCSMLCAGDSTQICGGQNGLSLYMVNASAITTTSTTAAATPTVPPTPTVVPSASGYTALGCYADNTNNKRALSTLYANDSMSIELCAAQASAKKAVYFGVEYGRECWTGSVLDANSQPIAQSKCNMKCPGNAAELCGAGNALQLYNLSSSTTTSAIATTTLSTTSSSTSAVVTTSSSSVATTSVVTTSSASTSTSVTPSSTVIPTTTTTSTSIVPTTTSSSAISTTSTSTSTSSDAPTTSTVITTTSTTSSTTTSSTPTQTPLVCPGSNNTTWIAPSGNSFVIECYIDHRGGDINMTYVNSYEGCITACDRQKGCVDVSLSGTACYMKGSVGQALNANGILGARLLYNVTTSTVTLSSTTFATTVTQTVTATAKKA